MMCIFKQIFLAVFVIFCSFTLFAQNPAESQIAALIDSGAYAQSFTRLQALKEESPSSSQYYTLSARLYYAMNSFPEALTNIYSAVKFAPRNATNFLIMGNTLRQLGRFAEARHSYNRGLELDAGYGQLYYESAQLSFIEQKYSDAERMLLLSRNFNPGSWADEVLASKLLVVRGQTNEAERRFLSLAASHPQDASVLQELADFYAAQKKYNKAATVLKEAELRFGESLARCQQIGDYSFLQGAYGEALLYYNKVKAIFGNRPFSGSALVGWRLHRLSLINGKTEEAESNLRAAFEQNPANQLYSAAFTQYLARHYPPGNSYRAVMAQFMQRQADGQRRLGYGTYYLSLLYKLLLLDPFNAKAIRELLNYSKIAQDESSVPALLEALLRANPGDKKALTTQRIRSHFEATGRLNQTPPRRYAYRTIFFIEDPVHQSADALGEEILFYNPLFPKMNIQTSKEDFVSSSRELFRRGIYGMAVQVQVQGASMAVRLFDKNGSLLQTKTLPYSPEYFTENILALLKYIHDGLAPIGYLDQRLPNGVFRTGLGARDGIKAGDILNIYDASFNPTAQLNVAEALPHSSTAGLNPGKIPPLGDGKGYYTVPLNLQNRINPLKIFIPEGQDAFNMDPFDPANKELENLRF